jgi:hypothetical protein
MRKYQNKLRNWRSRIGAKIWYFILWDDRVESNQHGVCEDCAHKTTHHPVINLLFQRSNPCLS